MNSVLIGVDFSVTDNDVKFLEMNTDVGISQPMLNYFDFTSLFNYINSNGFTKLHLVYKEIHITYEFIDLIKSHCVNNGIEYLETLVYSNAILLPTIEDSDTTLVLRLAYNAQAILDDLYCRDKSELIKLIFDNNLQEYIPQTYSIHNGGTVINDNLSNISDNGNIPNFIVKKTLPDTFKRKYPEFYKLSSAEELTNLKQSVPMDTVLQEYIYTPNTVIDSTIVNHIRYWYLLSNGLSDIVDLGGYIGSNTIQIEEDLISYTDNKLNDIARAMFFSNYKNGITFNGIPSNYVVKVKQPDGTFNDVPVKDVVVGDEIEAINIETLDPNFTLYETERWTYTGSLENLITYTTASVVSNINKEINDWIYRIEYVSGSSLLPADKLILVQDSGVVKFKNVGLLEIGDIIFNSSTVFSTVTAISREYYSGSIMVTDIEPSDVYISGNSENEIINTLIVHNPMKTT